MPDSKQAVDAGRLHGLDGMRGIAACVVAFGFHPQVLFPRGSFAGGWGGPVVDWVHRNGWSTVDLFFVLSGFVFAHVYLPGNKLAKAGGPGEFAVARLARLYPLHLLMLCLTAAVFHPVATNTLGAFFLHLFMLQALATPPGLTFVGPAWSISVEMFCYAVFALAAMRGERMRGIVTLAVIVAATTILLLPADQTGGTVTRMFARGFLGFFVGQTIWRWRDILTRLPTPLLLGVAMAGFFLDRTFDPALTLILTAWPAALLLALRFGTIGRGVFRWLGDRSYAIYLLHMPLIDFLVSVFGRFRLSPATFAGLTLFVVVTVLVFADIAYRNFELPSRQAIRQWWSRREARIVAAAPTGA